MYNRHNTYHMKHLTWHLHENFIGYVDLQYENTLYVKISLVSTTTYGFPLLCEDPEIHIRLMLIMDQNPDAIVPCKSTKLCI